MRAILLALALTGPALAGCITAAEVEPEEAIEPASAEPVEPAAKMPEPEPLEPEPANETVPEPVAPPPPDPCASPVRGLAHPCVLDGFHLGEAVYWNGGPLPAVLATGTPESCEATSGCHETTFRVAETAPGARLRVDAQVFFQDPSHVRPVADTHGGRETALDLVLFPPGADPVAGQEAARATTAGSFAASLVVGGFDPASREALPGPEVGTWTLRTYGHAPDAFAYRMRAKLEAPSPPSDEIAYPDLRIIPAFEVGFMVPTSSFQPGVPTPAAAPVASCMPEEHVEGHQNGLERATLCLRFSMGFANSGDGNWRLKMLDGEAAAPTVPFEVGEDLPVVQSVCTADGRLCRDLPRPEGLVARWDAWHEHYHYQNAYVFDLYQVLPSEGARPSLAHVSTSGKLGIDPGPETLVDWTSFAQLSRRAPVGTDVDGNEDPADKRLNAGWGDVYDWNRGGNYVPFPADAAMRPRAGEYVLVGATDPVGQIAETDDANNVGYTWFRIDARGQATILERGYGADPWDPAKAVLDVTP